MLDLLFVSNVITVSLARRAKNRDNENKGDGGNIHGEDEQKGGASLRDVLGIEPDEDEFGGWRWNLPAGDVDMIEADVDQLITDECGALDDATTDTRLRKVLERVRKPFSVSAARIEQDMEEKVQEAILLKLV